MVERKDKSAKKLEELKDFAKVAHTLAELIHLVTVPYAGHVLADIIYYQNQK